MSKQLEKDVHFLTNVVKIILKVIFWGLVIAFVVGIVVAALGG